MCLLLIFLLMCGGLRPGWLLGEVSPWVCVILGRKGGFEGQSAASSSRSSNRSNNSSSNSSSNIPEEREKILTSSESLGPSPGWADRLGAYLEVYRYNWPELRP